MAAHTAGASDEGKSVCVVYAGKTGSGKSTLIGSLDGVSKGSASALSDTVGTHVTVDTETGSKLMDTQGVSDSSGKVSDAAITTEVVRSLKENNVDCVKIVWTMDPSAKMTPELQAVAKFIHCLGKPVGVLAQIAAEPVDIWKSVMIIVKAATSARQAKGAIAAAKEEMKSNEYPYNYLGQDQAIPVFPLSIIEKLDEDDTQLEFLSVWDESKRFKKGLLKSVEVGPWQRGLISRLTQPSRIIFEDVKCKRCGVSGDPRGMTLHCHSDFKHRGDHEPVMKSAYRTDRFHPGALVPVNRPVYRTDYSHRGVLESVTLSSSSKKGGHWGNWVESGLAVQVVNVVNPVTWFSKDHRKEVYGHWDCCQHTDVDSTCTSTRPTTVIKYSGCGCRQGSEGCDSEEVQIGLEFDYNKWSGCGHREGDPVCESKQVEIGRDVDYERFSGCHCKVEADVDACPKKICSICEVAYGSSRPKDALCSGEHDFIQV